MFVALADRRKRCQAVGLLCIVRLLMTEKGAANQAHRVLTASGRIGFLKCNWNRRNLWSFIYDDAPRLNVPAGLLLAWVSGAAARFEVD